MHDLRAFLKAGMEKASCYGGKEFYRREWITVFLAGKSGSAQWQ
ncbi:hypothetical protein WC5_01223 [Escherichia sp. KTE114]|nr:hypothetical protein WC5_01223 [Escherichia sp. KTE114]